MYFEIITLILIFLAFCIIAWNVNLPIDISYCEFKVQGTDAYIEYCIIHNEENH